MDQVTALLTFLKARVDEDDEVARATRRNEQRVPHTERWFASHSSAITSMAPHRAVAEVESKRRIIERCEHDLSNYIGAGTQAATPYLVLRLLAGAYDWHPAYDEAWRP
jgi:hypothetical protein